MVSGTEGHAVVPSDSSGGRKRISVAPSAQDSGGGSPRKPPAQAIRFHAEKAQSQTFDKIKEKKMCEGLRERCRLLCNSWRFCVVTTTLTIYALFGDDFRLALTHLRTDYIFDGFTIICILVFALEIFAATLGQAEYFLGFFFQLDCLSTVTLVFDLSMVGNALFCGDAAGGSALRAGRAGKPAARAGRTVRIIRLIRLVKLYKTYKSALEQKQKAKRRASQEMEEFGPNGRSSGLMPGEGDSDDEQPSEADKNDETGGLDDNNNKLQAETRVGKKLSDMTTRRVIILVLVMLIVMPQFSPSSYSYNEFRASAYTGVDLVYSRFREWCPVDGDERPWCLEPETWLEDAAQEERALARSWFERYFLGFLYHHHAGRFSWSLYWVGVNSGASDNGVEAHLEVLGQLGQRRLLPAEVGPDTWDSLFVDERWQTLVQPLPAAAKERLAEPWVERCLNFVGVPLQRGVEPASGGCSRCSICSELRCSEREHIVPMALSLNETDRFQFLFTFDTRGTTKLESTLSIFQTIFICFAVGIGALTFSNDANQLLLNPIERMISKMETIKDNPLEAMKLGDLEYRREEVEAALLKETLASKGRFWKVVHRFCSARKVREPMETVILEKTIIKLGGLLALGFGEAGAEIVSQNMKGSGNSSGVNAVVPGQKIDAILGFCSIRDFMMATEVLKERVMLFVNQVAEIVHGCVDDYHGATNKNIGDSFLLVWRLSGVEPDRQTKLADMSMMAFIRILSAINRSPLLAEYRSHPGMLLRVPNYRVQMGFGMHCGWAIEGAIGSTYKIDASYLSPNVNVAARLESASKQFGVWLLVSHFMIQICSREMAGYCRLIDHATVKGSRQPLRLFTVDLDYMQLQVTHKCMDRVIRNRFKVRQIREVRKNDKWSDDVQVWEAFETDEDLASMRAPYFAEFFQRFSMAYRNYESGAWMVARDMLFTCHFRPRSTLGAVKVSEKEWPVDGPTVALLQYMRRTGYESPEGWPGHRELTEK